jgi:hypothetical protein
VLLQAVINRRLDQALSGFVRLVARGIPPGARLSGSLVFAHAPARCMPYFLGPDDRLAQDAARVTFSLAGEAWEKGLWIEGDAGAILGIDAVLDGRPLPPASIRIGAGAPYAGGPVSSQALGSRSWPAASPGEGIALFVWRHDERGGAASGRLRHDSEMERRLHALGYI